MKNQKPIEYDVHLKYICPKCGQPHWLSFKEASTKNFKVVCDCDTVFKVKRLEAFKVKYIDKISSKNKTKSESSTLLSKEILNKCVKILSQYGFTANESKDLVSQSYNEVKSADIGILIKTALTKFGAKNVI